MAVHFATNSFNFKGTLENWKKIMFIAANLRVKCVFLNFFFHKNKFNTKEKSAAHQLRTTDLEFKIVLVFATSFACWVIAIWFLTPELEDQIKLDLV